MAKRYTYGAFDQANIFSYKISKLTNAMNPAGGKNFWMGYQFMVYYHPSGKKSLPLPFLAGCVSGNH